MKLLISNIQRMSLSDGPGMRTTVFLMGCPLRCPWCSNPENLENRIRPFFREEKCLEKKVGCPLVKRCDIFSKAAGDRQSLFSCPVGAAGQYGKETEPEELVCELQKDREYWGTEGGVTFSGGEALLQAHALTPVLRELKNEGISIVLETSLFVDRALLDMVLPYVDWFYVDVKILDEEDCKKFINGDSKCYRNNVDRLLESTENITFRVPCNDRYTLTEKNIALLLSFFEGKKRFPIEIFATHTLGNEKYRALGMGEPEKLTAEKLSFFRDALIQQGNQVTVLNFQ